MAVNREHVARTLNLSRSKALRVVYWLQRLHERDIVHGDVGIVGFKHSEQGIGVLVATTDYSNGEIGCAWCGEWLGEHAKPLQPNTRAIYIGRRDLPHDIRELGLSPAILYCAECWGQYDSILLQRCNAIS